MVNGDVDAIENGPTCTVTRAPPETLPDVAVIVVVPGLIAETVPADTVATAELDELQVAVAERSRELPSE